MTRFPGHPEAGNTTAAESPPARPRARPRSRTPRIALSIAAALALVGLGVGAANLDNQHLPGVASTPTATSAATHDGDPHRSSNPLYAVSWSPAELDCSATPQPAPPVPNPELADHLRQIVACLVDQHRPAVEAVGLTLTVPTIAVYSTDVRSACGLVTRDFPAFYCSADETIYVRYDSDDDPDGYGRSAWGYWIVMTHEFGHHLQQRAGIFDEYTQQRTTAGDDELAALSRRLELQATCFSGAFFKAAGPSISFGDAQADEAMDFYRRSSQHAADTHGSAETAASWFDTGYRSQNLGDCNTWDAPVDQVS